MATNNRRRRRKHQIEEENMDFSEQLTITYLYVYFEREIECDFFPKYHLLLLSEATIHFLSVKDTGNHQSIL